VEINPLLYPRIHITIEWETLVFESEQIVFLKAFMILEEIVRRI
jgi:hypothetical protein